MQTERARRFMENAESGWMGYRAKYPALGITQDVARDMARKAARADADTLESYIGAVSACVEAFLNEREMEYGGRKEEEA